MSVVQMNNSSNRTIVQTYHSSSGSSSNENPPVNQMKIPNSIFVGTLE